MKPHQLASVFLGLLILPAARGDLITLTSVKDNTIYSDLPSNSNGLGGPAGQEGLRFDSGRTAGSGVRRGLVAFDVASSLPTGATVHSVTLTLTLNQVLSPVGGPTTTVVALHRVLADWGEGTSGSQLGQGAPATPGDATWTHTFFNTSSWATPGGDFVSTASASQVVGGQVNPQYTWTSPQLAADVQAWLDTPWSNSGWILINDETINRTVRSFFSHEWSANPAFRPQLTIDFTPAIVAVPEPSSQALLGTAAVLLTGASTWRRRSQFLRASRC